MPFVRLTWLQPRADCESEVGSLIYDLDDKLSHVPGFLDSLVILENSHICRASVWSSKEDANREAVSDGTLSLRSRLRYLSVAAEESMLEVPEAPSPDDLDAMLRARIMPPRPAFSS